MSNINATNINSENLTVVNLNVTTINGRPYPGSCGRCYATCSGCGCQPSSDVCECGASCEFVKDECDCDFPDCGCCCPSSGTTGPTGASGDRFLTTTASDFSAVPTAGPGPLSITVESGL